MDEGVALPGRSSMLVGRDVEIAALDAFVAAVARGPRAVTIGGEPGIGKTALWREAIARARAVGIRVLVTRPAEEEMALDLVGLVDLFGEDDLDLLALRRQDDAFARGRAVLEALKSSSGRAPTVVAVDDVQWLDQVSARALRYALRRLESEPIGLLLTVRPGPVDPNDLPNVLSPDRRVTIELGPLGMEDLRRVLGATVESISRPMLRRIHEVSGGNPLYAIELVRGLELDERVEYPSEFPLPDSLQAAIARRLDRLSPELSPLLETTSALGSTSVRELREFLPDAEVDRLLEAAEDRGLVIVEEDLEVRLAHPLVGSGVYARMSPIARRSLHARLAELSGDPDVRARHLALSTHAREAGVAQLLEDAAARASARGATDLAAEFARHSVRLTPHDDQDASRRRAIAEIGHLAAAGEASRALELTDRLVAGLPPGPARAEALLQRFYVVGEDLDRADRLLVRALQDAEDDELLRGRVLDILGWLRGMFRGDLPAGLECSREAAAIAERHADADLRMLTAAHLGHMESLAGRPRPELMARAVALADEIGRPRLGGGPRAWSAKQALWAGELGRSEEMLHQALADDARSGNELERPYRLYDLALLECAQGELQAARAFVHEGIESARDAENADAEGWMYYPQAVAESWLGRAEESRAAALDLLAWGGRRGGIPGIARARSALGLLALAEGDADAAGRELSEGVRLLETWGFAHPGALPIVPDGIDAFARAGDLTRAKDLLDRLGAEADALDQAWTTAAFERGRGTWLAAAGEEALAVTSLEAALAGFDRLGCRTDAGRAALELGRALLRAGRRTAAADALIGARDRFASMGAGLWVARAEEELDRAAPGRAVGTLTDVELRVARLVAQGRKNREVAADLYMSVASVEAHLTRVYRKLAIRSRSDLARIVAEGAVEFDDPPGGDPEP